MEYPVKSLSDYEAAKFILEDTVYEPNYEAYVWADRHVGDDGFVRVDCKSPFQSLLLNFMGYKTLAMEVHRHRKEFEDLLKAMEGKYYEVIHILANSPAEVVGIDGNINGRVTSPRFFEKYLLPFYKRASEILHEKNKIVSVHMDGALACLRDLIPKTGIDVVEAFTPPPLGDLPLSEARNAWGEDIIIETNFPEIICLEGVDATKRYAKEMLRTVAPCDGFILSVTEDIPYKEPNDILERSLRAITDVMLKHGKYPVKIDMPPIQIG